MNKEINYLKEHLYEIYKYKKSQKDLTYDMDLELLLRTCKALDFKQKENIQLQSNWNSLREFVEELYNNEDGSWAVCGARYVLDKMNELEGKDKERIQDLIVTPM